MKRESFVRAAVVAGGLLYLITGLTQLFMPAWFFENVGNFPPYNRHYIGDLGTFSLGLGIALLWAVRNPLQHRLLIGCAALVSLLHALNHAYDDLGAPLADWLSQTIPLLIFGGVLLLAYWVSSHKVSALK
jgi:hypothetical protein